MVLLLLMSGHVAAQRPLTLDSCRFLAIRNNKELKIKETQRDVAYYNRKSAFTNYLPKISATGAYVRTQKEISLLGDDKKTQLNNLGNIFGAKASVLFPQMDAQTMTGLLNNAGSGLVDALRTDTRNITALSVMFTQPVFMGGKIKAYNNITKYAEQIAGNDYNLGIENIIVDVDNSYWKIVELKSKKGLAEKYLELVERLDGDVEQMIKEGVATKSDGLRVKVKLNEAKVTMIQIDNGLSLCRMNLCQICGIDMNDSICLADENMNMLPNVNGGGYGDMNVAMENRPELKSLDAATKIYEEKVKVARAEFLPQVALTGGYLMSDPSIYNGFQKKFKGNAFIGVVLKVPMVTWGDRFYKVKAAKAEALGMKFKYDETKEKIELQIKQCNQKLQEANERLGVAQKGLEEADENLKYANYGMKEGVIPLTNVLEAQTAWLSAHSTYITAQIDCRLADVYLRKSLGILK